MLGGHELRTPRCQQRLDVALQVEEVDHALGQAPLRRIDGAVGQRSHAHRLAHAGDVERASGGRGIAHEHAADLEHPHPCRAPCEVVAQHAHQAAEQARAHHRQRRGDRIQHADRVVVAGQFAFAALFDEAEVDRFLIVACGHRMAHRVRGRRRFRHLARRDHGQRRRVGQVLQPDDADHLFDQILFDLQVEAPARRRDGDAALASFEVATPGVRRPRRTAPASAACRAPWRRAPRACAPVSRGGSRSIWSSIGPALSAAHLDAPAR